MVEGGYLGFTELQYPHMPLPGERLVAFLSDGAFEEQRGSDWAPRWWRARDCGLIAPIMIANGRRIDQRTTMAQEGGTAWFRRYLELNGFDPIVFDGRDPAAFVWAIYEIERRLEAAGSAAEAGAIPYPVPLPYGVAEAPKGAGFYGEGTNLAHNLPLGANPHTDAAAAANFNTAARRLWVPFAELEGSIHTLRHHIGAHRPRERDHPLAHRDVHLRTQAPVAHAPVAHDRADRATWQGVSPMDAVDQMFLATAQANPQLRPRVGNPDEMRSNRMQNTLDALKFRVTAPEPGIPEDVYGAVITALNEEAVAAAALGNKGGVNIIVTYEAFGAKMLGAVRQEVIWAAHARAAGHPSRWLSVPLALTSHTWENGKNEQSHQDPTLAEALLGEAGHVSRVLFPLDFNSAAAVMHAVYRTHGQIWTLVVPKADSVASLFTPEEARRLVEQGAIRIAWAGHAPEQSRLALTAVGAYQLHQALRASERLRDRGVAHHVVALLEPGRFRAPRSEAERTLAAPQALLDDLYPAGAARLFLTHTRPEPLLGALQQLNTGAGATAALGYRNVGGTLATGGLLFINGCTWAHALAEAARLLALPQEALLSPEELAALAGQRSPEGVII